MSSNSTQPHFEPNAPKGVEQVMGAYNSRMPNGFESEILQPGQVRELSPEDIHLQAANSPSTGVRQQLLTVVKAGNSEYSVSEVFDGEDISYAVARIGALGERAILIGQFKAGEQMLIGRNTANQNDLTLSREHFSVAVDANGCIAICDEESTNGTQLVSRRPESSEIYFDDLRWAVKGSEVAGKIPDQQPPSITDEEYLAIIFKYSGFVDPKYMLPDFVAEEMAKLKKLVDKAPIGESRDDVVRLLKDGKLAGYPIPVLMGKYGKGDHSNKVEQLVELYLRNPELACEITKNNVIGFHGTKSGALHGILAHDALLSAAEARNRGQSLLTGEQTYSKEGGQNTISFADWREPGTIKGYSGMSRPLILDDLIKKMRTYKNIFDEWETDPSSRANYLTEDHPFVYNLRQAIKDLEQSIKLISENPDGLESRLILGNFPIAFGVSGDTCKSIGTMIESEGTDECFISRIRSDIPGEFMYKGKGISLSNIPLILTEAKRIDELKQLLKQFGHGHIIVRDIEDMAQGSKLNFR